MIILHSLSLLKRLSEVESCIQKWESLMDEKGVEVDRKKYFEQVFLGQSKLTEKKDDLE